MLAGIVPLPSPPFLMALRTSDLSGFTWSRFGPTFPFVPASASVWQVPQFCWKSCLPWATSAALPPPPPPPPPVFFPPPDGVVVVVVVVVPPPPPDGAAAAVPPPLDVLLLWSSMTSAGMPSPNTTRTAPKANQVAGSARSRIPPRKRARPISSRAQRTSKAAALCHGARA